MAHRRKIDTKEHFQEPGRRPQFYRHKRACTERDRQIMVGLGDGVQMPLLDTERRI